MCLERCCILGPGSSDRTSREANSVAGRKRQHKGVERRGQDPCGSQGWGCTNDFSPTQAGPPRRARVWADLSQPPREVLGPPHAASGSQASSRPTPAPQHAWSVLGSYTCSPPGHLASRLIPLCFLASSPSPLCFLSGPSHAKEGPGDCQAAWRRGHSFLKSQSPLILKFKVRNEL